MIPDSILHYKIEKKLGEGSMGAVYLAENTHLHQRVALKFLPLHFSNDPALRERLEREAVAAASLSHPNIVTVHDLHEHEGQPFIAMEYLEGSTLSAWCDEQDPAIEDILDVAIQIGEGLKKAHEAGIVHRDLKPSNILVDRDGRPKILDFGLAQLKGAKKVTKSGSILGTAAYMSPEQGQGQKVGHRTDLWSLGVILYEMIARRLPFDAEHEAAVTYAIAHEEPEPLARYKKGAPDELQRIVSKCLAKDPRERYQSASDLVADLMALRRLSSIGSVPVAYPSRKSSRWVAMLAVLGVAVIAVGAALVWNSFSSNPDLAAPDRKMIAVLPFENLGDSEDTYFADGITDEITTRLAKVRGLGVIGRASAIRYAASDKSMETIGKELGVDFVLAGTVRWQRTSAQGGRVRVTPQLVKCSDKAQVWADVYDEFVMDIFDVQTSIAGEVVRALNVALVDAEKLALRTQPTANLEAYQYYLRGRAIWASWENGREDLDRASILLERAIALDTTFADAYAELSGIHSWYVESGIDKSDERRRLARQTAELASRYDSLQAYSRVAWGYYYYYVLKDFNRAHAELEAAYQKLPSNSETVAALGYVKRRRGQWNESFELQKRACELNPYNFWILYGVSQHAIYMRLWQEAQMYVDQEIERFPDRAMPYRDKALLYLRRDGDPQAALSIIDRSGLRQQFLLLDIKLQCFYFAQDYTAALETVRQIHGGLTSPSDTAHYYFQMAELSRRLNQVEASRAYYDSARICVESLQASGQQRAGRLPPSLGQIYAGLGLKEEAIMAARRDTAAIPLHEDALLGQQRLVHLALTYIGTGEYDPAIDLIDTLLAVPSDLTVAWLRGHPDYDPLRDHPRFQALLEKGDTRTVF